MTRHLKILLVEDLKPLKVMFQSALQNEFSNAEIIAAETLEEARSALKCTDFDAIATDCGFPTRDSDERLHGNRNGLLLIKEIRRGDYRKYNAIVPIAFNSAEMDSDKSETALSYGGNTKAFRKGAYYPGLRVGNLDTNFTKENVAGASVRWLKTELTEEKIESREAAVAVPEAPASTGLGMKWRKLFSLEHSMQTKNQPNSRNT